MNYILLSVLNAILLLGAVGAEANAQDTFIQVKSEPGISVYLDGIFIGVTTSEFNGLIIEEVQPGERVIGLIKEGFNPKEETILVRAGEVFSYRITSFIPDIVITERGREGEQNIDKQVGSLKIQSVPLEIDIKIDQLGIEVSKTKDEWIIEGVPPGNLVAVFSEGEKRFVRSFDIKENHEVHLFINMLSGEVKVRSMKPMNGAERDISIVENPLAHSTPPSTTESIPCGEPITFTYLGEEVTYGTVVSGNGRCWLDRNLGAGRVAQSSTDTQAYGHLFQWGRTGDGHQRRDSQTTTTLSDNDQPEHGRFILAADNPWDWRREQRNDLWQESSSANNPCPIGFRLPTNSEWDLERLSWRGSHGSGAFNSPLKLPLAGFRNGNDGLISGAGTNGGYWASSVEGTYSRNIFIVSSLAFIRSFDRALGFSVRCIQD